MPLILTRPRRTSGPVVRSGFYTGSHSLPADGFVSTACLDRERMKENSVKGLPSGHHRPSNKTSLVDSSPRCTCVCTGHDANTCT